MKDMNLPINDELKKILADNLNSQKLLMNQKTGTVQSAELWNLEKTEAFDQNELVEVKLINDAWIRVS